MVLLCLFHVTPKLKYYTRLNSRKSELNLFLYFYGQMYGRYTQSLGDYAKQMAADIKKSEEEFVLQPCIEIEVEPSFTQTPE